METDFHNFALLNNKKGTAEKDGIKTNTRLSLLLHYRVEQ